MYTASLRDKNQFIVGGHLNMRHILERFVVHFNDLYSDSEGTSPTLHPHILNSKRCRGQHNTAAYKPWFFSKAITR